jgi:hypothetical protein
MASKRKSKQWLAWQLNGASMAKYEAMAKIMAK